MIVGTYGNIKAHHNEWRFALKEILSPLGLNVCATGIELTGPIPRPQGWDALMIWIKPKTIKNKLFANTPSVLSVTLLGSAHTENNIKIFNETLDSLPENHPLRSAPIRLGGFMGPVVAC